MTPADPRALRAEADIFDASAAFIREQVSELWTAGKVQAARDYERLAEDCESAARALNVQARRLEQRAELFGVACEIANHHQGN